MKNVLVALLAVFSFTLHAQNKVGINIVVPESVLDIRSLADDETPDLQLATPSLGHFLRLFSGHDDDAKPYLLYSKSDTFRIATSATDYSLFTERMAILPNGYIGLNHALTADINEPFIAFADLVDYIPFDGPTSPTGSLGLPVNSTFGAGQTILIGESGRVIGIDINARSLGSGIAKFNYIIKENDHNGIPLDAGSVEVPFPSFGYVSVPIYPIEVAPGQVIFIELTFDSGDDGECNANDTNPYPDGEAWSFDGTWTSNPSDDLAFFVWMEVPDTNRVHGISLLDGTAQARLGEIIFPRELGYPSQVLIVGYNGQLMWGDQGEDVFINVGGVVQNSGDHFTDDFVFGDYNLTSTFTNLFFFDKDKGAFRAGRTTNNHWQPAYIGDFSFATGWNTKASGYCAQASGYITEAIGNYSTAMGYHNITFGKHSMASGKDNVVAGDNSAAFGFSNGADGLAAFVTGNENSALGAYSMATGQLNQSTGSKSFSSGLGSIAAGAVSMVAGTGNQSYGYANLVVGMYNDPILAAPQTAPASTSPMFIVGNGTNDFVRSNAFLVRKDGRVGIGTNVPNNNVHVYGNAATGIKIESVEDDAFLALENLSDDWEIRLDQSEGNELDWRYNGITKMVLSTDGRLAIGSEDMATDYQLSVDGKIIAEEVRCQLKVDWPDYVFADGYKLMSLDHVEQAIKKEGHLPGIPAASTINGQGVDLGDMQVKMMEKIEELTLHIIALNKRVIQLEEENIKLKN